ncbi:MAG TPA: MFS transporter [Thermoanaerobaculia bacterium]|nr:MFS transporter [Thermoanaerobaculia bacterium]
MSTSLLSVPARAWKALVAAQLGWMLDAMDFLLFTFALRAIQKEFGLSSASMGLLTSVSLIASGLGGILFGRLADRIGRVTAMSVSILCYSLATGGLAFSQTVAQLVFWRVLVGLGMGGEWSCGSVLVAESWPDEHRAKAMAMMQSAWAVGALAAAGLSALVLEPYGWRRLFLIGATPALLAFFVRRGVEEPDLWQRSERGAATFGPMFRSPLLRRTVIASLVSSCVLIAYWGIISWLPTFLATSAGNGGAGLSVTKSARWLILLQLGALAGYLSFGWFADRFGRRPSFTLFMIGAAIVVPVYAFAANDVRVLLLVGPLVGFFAHGYFSVFGALLAELFPTAIRGTAQGFCYNIGRLASAASPFLIGAAIDAGGFRLALASTALFFAAAGILIWFLPETRGTSLSAIEN